MRKRTAASGSRGDAAVQPAKNKKSTDTDFIKLMLSYVSLTSLQQQCTKSLGDACDTQNRELLIENILKAANQSEVEKVAMSLCSANRKRFTADGTSLHIIGNDGTKCNLREAVMKELQSRDQVQTHDAVSKLKNSLQRDGVCTDEWVKAMQPCKNMRYWKFLRHWEHLGLTSSEINKRDVLADISSLLQVIPDCQWKKAEEVIVKWYLACRQDDSTQQITVQNAQMDNASSSSAPVPEPNQSSVATSSNVAVSTQAQPGQVSASSSSVPEPNESSVASSSDVAVSTQAHPEQVTASSSTGKRRIEPTLVYPLASSSSANQPIMPVSGGGTSTNAMVAYDSTPLLSKHGKLPAEYDGQSAVVRTEARLRAVDGIQIPHRVMTAMPEYEGWVGSGKMKMDTFLNKYFDASNRVQAQTLLAEDEELGRQIHNLHMTPHTNPTVDMRIPAEESLQAYLNARATNRDAPESESKVLLSMNALREQRNSVRRQIRNLTKGRQEMQNTFSQYDDAVHENPLIEMDENLDHSLDADSHRENSRGVDNSLFTEDEDATGRGEGEEGDEELVTEEYPLEVRSPPQRGDSDAEREGESEDDAESSHANAIVRRDTDNEYEYVGPEVARGSGLYPFFAGSDEVSDDES